MPKTASLSIQLDENIKKTAEEVYSHYGLSLSDAITVFIYESCDVGGLPFDLRPKSYNNQTLTAMAEAEKITNVPSVKGYKI